VRTITTMGPAVDTTLVKAKAKAETSS